MAITRAQIARQLYNNGGEILKVQTADANELHVIASILEIQPREVTS